MKRKVKNMRLRTVKKSNGKFEVQMLEVTPKEQWVVVEGNFDTLLAAEDYIINSLGIDIKQEVVATYEYNTKTNM